MERFISPTERLAYADRRLKEGIKPEIVAEECGYKNKASLQACIHTYRSTKRASIDATEPPEKPDYMQKATPDATFTEPFQDVRTAAREFMKAALPTQQQKALIPQPEPEPEPDPEPLAPVELPAMPELDLPGGVFVPSCFKIAMVKSDLGEFTAEGGELHIYAPRSRYNRADALELAKQITEATDLFLPEVPNEPA